MSIPVTLIVLATTTDTLQQPTPIAFTMPLGGPNPVAQGEPIAATGAVLELYPTVVETAAGSSWLTTSCTSYFYTPTSCNFTVAGTSLPTGVYPAQAIFQIYTGNANTSIAVPLSLTVGNPNAVPSLGISKSHSGNFAPGQTGALYTVTVSNAPSAASTSGTVTVTENLPSGLSLVSMSGSNWSCTGNVCTRGDSLAAGAQLSGHRRERECLRRRHQPAGQFGDRQRRRLRQRHGQRFDGDRTIGDQPYRYAGSGQSAAINTAFATALQATLTGSSGPISGATVTFTAPGSGASGTFSGQLTATATTNASGVATAPTFTANGVTGNYNVVATALGVGAAASFSLTNVNGSAGLALYPVTPCRVVDTRNANGTFGGPIMSPGSTRVFAIPSSACNIPATAQAYSLNITVVPPGPLGYLTAWPTGQTQPYVSTLNSSNGAIVANAAIVPAGTGGAISIFVSDATHVIIDINGYFAPPARAGGLAFYPVTPCRVADTRNANGAFGGPSLTAGGTRNFTVPSSLRHPGHRAGLLAEHDGRAARPAGIPDRLADRTDAAYVSTLNALQGQIAANAAIVPAGASGRDQRVRQRRRAT